MNIHEFQAKNILNTFGALIQRGYVASTQQRQLKLLKNSKETGTQYFVIKAQIHAGGRGKGGGVKLAKSIDEVYKLSNEILGMNLVTPQTPKQGKKVYQVLIAEDVYYEGDSKIEEFYISILLNRSSSKNMIMYSPEGGVDIEAVAEKTPELIFNLDICPKEGLTEQNAKEISDNLNLVGIARENMLVFIRASMTHMRSLTAL